MLLILASVVSGTIVLQRCTSENKAPAQEQANTYIGDQSCQSCHRKQYDQWALSDHFKAMQPANDTTVLGDFNNKTYTADGVSSRFFKKDGKYFINTQGEDGDNHDYEIQYTFGYKPLQQYLVAFPGGRLQVTRQSWDTEKKRWFQQYAGQKIPAGDWLSWTGNAQNWNTMCSRCHSTDLQKNYDFATDTYHTTYSVMTVSCESCHGPAGKHVEYVESADYKKGKKIPGSFLLAGTNSDQVTIINTCAPCHARAGEIAQAPAYSRELLDNYIPALPTTESFFADGQMRDEDYNYTSFLESKMFTRGVYCTNCHDPHSGKLYYANNQTCLQCHDKKYDLPTHTFHAVNTEGALCKSCHMPQTTYMGNDPRHDHTFRVPRPDLSVRYGTPNACNKCHTDKPAQWAAGAINKWYGPKRAYHFAEDLIPASREDSNTIIHAIRIISDTSNPGIITASALYYLRNIITPQSAEVISKELTHPNAQVRYQALRSLSNFPARLWLQNVYPLLSDKVRAVRIAAADLLVTVPSAQIAANYHSALASAKAELQQYVLYQTDFASGNILAGDYYLKLDDFRSAQIYYERALKKDSLLNAARLNLSVAYNQTGRNTDALKVLQQAAAIQPKNDMIYFNLALLYNEMNDKENAEKSLAKAVALHSQNPRVYYNYGLLLQQKGKTRDAIEQLQKAVQLAPNDADLVYALCWIYTQNGQIAKARQVGGILKRLNTGVSEYEALIRQLGL